MTTRLSWTRLVILTEDWPPLSAKDLMIVQAWNQYSRYAICLIAREVSTWSWLFKKYDVIFITLYKI